MPNIVSPESGVLRVRDAHTAMKREAFSWDDMQWIRALWKGPIVIKGVFSRPKRPGSRSTMAPRRWLFPIMEAANLTVFLRVSKSCRK